MKPGPLLLAHSRPYRDAQLAFPVESEIADRASVRTTGDRLQLVNNLHRPKFWRAGHAAAGKTGGESIEMRCAGMQTPLDRRNQMLHLGEFFQTNKLGHLHRTEFADFSQVIAEQVSNHHQFRHFFGAGLQLVSKLRVSRRIAGPGTRPLYWPRLYVRTAQTQKEFRRGRYNLEIAAIHIRRKRSR